MISPDGLEFADTVFYIVALTSWPCVRKHQSKRTKAQCGETRPRPSGRRPSGARTRLAGLLDHRPVYCRHPSYQRANPRLVFHRLDQSRSGIRNDRSEGLTSIRLFPLAILVVLGVMAWSVPTRERPDLTRAVGPVAAASPYPIDTVGVAPTATRPSAAVSVPPTPVPTAFVGPASPEQLDQRTVDGAQILTGGWAVGKVRLTFQVTATSADPLVPEVAVASADQPISSQPTAQGSLVTPAGGSVAGLVTVPDLSPGQYRWQARFRDSTTGSISPWSPFGSGDADFGLIQNAPTITALTVTGTHPARDGSPSIGAADQPTLHWTVIATLTIMPAATTEAVRTFASSGTHIDLPWDGKEAQGKIVANGSYRILINAADVFGNSTQAIYTGLQISDKLIAVSLSTQSLTAMAGAQVILKTLVTSTTTVVVS